MRLKLSWTWLVLLVLFSTGVNATTTTALEVVKDTAGQVLDKIKEEREQLDAHPERIYDLVNEFVIPHFDFTSMSKWVLGKNWRSATVEQQGQFTEEFKTLLVRTYAKALLEYSNQDIKYLSEDSSPKSNLVLVKTEVEQPGATSIPIHYWMHISGGDWKVVNVVVDGVSLVSTYRGEYASLIRKNGMDYLITRLTERNAQSLVSN